MAEVETKVKSDGAADEESRVIEATDSEAPQIEANASVKSPDVPKELPADNDAQAEPSASVLAEMEEEEPIAMVTEEGMGDEVEGEQKKKASTIEKEEERKEVGTRRKNTRGRAVRRKKKAAGIDGIAELSGPVLGKTEEQASAVMTASSNDKMGEQGEKEGAKNEEEVEEEMKKGALSKRVSRTQKRKKAALAVAATSTGATVEIAEGNREESMDVEEKVENALREEDEEHEGDTQKLETEVLTTSAAINSDAAEDSNGEQKVADKEKVDGAPRKKNKNKKKKKRNNVQVAASEAAMAAEVGATNKLSDAKAIAGMIFMCSSKTKMDCYKYKVFGMPAGKKETVAKAYKGMKLFLFDIDLKLMYGIYKASSKGGYNIQPKAFKSSFPSQVRFNVLKDCSPLPEEKFKAAIKANYFKKHAFRCELSAEQVKNLSKLFFEATKASRVTNGRATKKRASRTPASQDTKRRRYQDTVSRPLVVPDDHMFPRSHDIYEREAYAPPPPLRFPVAPYGSAAPREAPLPLYSSPPRLYSSPPRLSAFPPPPAYAAYERPMDVDYHRRELPPPLEGHGYRIVDPEARPSYDLDPVGHSDPYGLHREPAPYHETRYPTLPSGYYPPAPSSYYPPAHPPYGR